MIRYTVLWRKDTENELAALWLNYPQRHEITQATDRIDAELKIDAHEKGFLLPGDLRAFSSSPLTAYFRIDNSDRKVFVEAVRLTEIN